MFSSAQPIKQPNPSPASGDEHVQPQRRTVWIVRLSIAVILLIHALLLLDGSRKNFVVIDEAGHLVAGISHWTTGTYSMYRVNPPLARMLAVIPVFLLHPDTKAIQPVLGTAKRAEFECANPFALDNAERYLDILFLARLAGILWSCLGGWLVYRWGSDLYSNRAGLLALVLWCFNPSILAHAQVVTPDLPATVAGLAATYCFWRYLREPSWFSAMLTGVVLGIAELTKFTLLYLYALGPLLWLLNRWRLRVAGNSTVPFWSQFGQCLAMVGISILIINLGYEFQGTGKPLGGYVFVTRALGGDPPPDASYVHSNTNRFKDSWLGTLPVPLPAEFLSGIDRQRLDFEVGSFSFLRGEWKRGGWWYYYLYALAVKLPIGLLALVVWGFLSSLIGYPYRTWLVYECFLWLPVLSVMVLVSSQTGFNHHMRYVLPIFPFLIVGASRLSWFLSHQHWKTGLLVLSLTLWSIASTLVIHPHYLSYFNEVAGGPDNGHNHLIDSNIDWGQDLLFLKAWLEKHPEAHPLRLAAFNTIDPGVIGIQFTLPPLGPISRDITQDSHFRQLGPHPGYYALDVNFVHGYAYPVADSRGQFGSIRLHEYEYFQHFHPIAKAGYSIFIYHITLEEANAVRRELGLPALTAADVSSEIKP
ncbi:MAG TPA: glycosyltransferase family 39 protein [Gemmataceae bacterium]|nr:glycosyltransferase family 39 protein [Gemmataceae bacterium]